MTTAMQVNVSMIPDGWSHSRFKDFAVLQRGKDLTDSNVIPGKYPVVKSNGVDIYHTEFFVEPPGVVTGRSGTIGNAFFIDSPFWAHNTTLYVKDFKENDPKFIYYLIKRMDFRRYLAGTTVPTLNRNDIHALKVSIPASQSEQKVIAGIISKVDEAIEAVESSIKSAVRLKKSLMQNLLTGKLKPDGTWRSEDDFFVNDKFGKVPKGWAIRRVREISFNFDSQRKPIKAEDRKNISGSYPYYGAAGIIDWVNDYIFDGEYILFGEDGNNLLSRKSPQAFIVKGKFWPNNHAHVIQANPEFTTNRYLCEQLESKDYRPIIYGSAQPKINKRDLNGIKVLVPDDITEQIRITDSIGAFNMHEDCLDMKKTSLLNLKKSLMQNLLTGKVRVDVEKINKLLEEV